MVFNVIYFIGFIMMIQLPVVFYLKCHGKQCSTIAVVMSPFVFVVGALMVAMTFVVSIMGLCFYSIGMPIIIFIFICYMFYRLVSNMTVS